MSLLLARDQREMTRPTISKRPSKAARLLGCRHDDQLRTDTTVRCQPQRSSAALELEGKEGLQAQCSKAASRSELLHSSKLRLSTFSQDHTLLAALKMSS